MCGAAEVGWLLERQSGVVDAVAVYWKRHVTPSKLSAADTTHEGSQHTFDQLPDPRVLVLSVR